MNSLKLYPYQIAFLNGGGIREAMWNRAAVAGPFRGRMVVPSEAVQKGPLESILSGGAREAREDAAASIGRHSVALQRVCNGYRSGEEPQEVTR